MHMYPSNVLHTYEGRRLVHTLLCVDVLHAKAEDSCSATLQIEHWPLNLPHLHPKPHLSVWCNPHSHIPVIPTAWLPRHVPGVGLWSQFQLQALKVGTFQQRWLCGQVQGCSGRVSDKCGCVGWLSLLKTAESCCTYIDKREYTPTAQHIVTLMEIQHR